MTFKEVVDTRTNAPALARTFPVCIQSNLKHISLPLTLVLFIFIEFIYST